MDIDSIKQENNDLRQIELRSENEVKSIENALIALQTDFEKKKDNIKRLEDNLEEHLSKKKKIEANMKNELYKIYSKKKLMLFSDSRNMLSSACMESFVYSQQNTDGSFAQLQIPTKVSSLIKSSIQYYEQMAKTEYSSIIDKMNSISNSSISFDSILSYIRNVFCKAITKQAVENEKTHLLTQVYDKDLLLLFNHKKPDDIFTPIPTFENNNQTDCDDFIAFSIAKTPIIEDEEDIINSVFRKLQLQRNDKTIRKSFRQLIPSLPKCKIQDALRFIRNKIDTKPQSELLWLLYIKLYCVSSMDLRENTLRSLITSAIANCPNSPGLALFLLQLVCSIGCNKSFIHEVWLYFRNQVSNSFQYTEACLIGVAKMLFGVYPSLFDEEILVWFRSHLSDDYLQIFDSIIHDEKYLPILSLPSGCPILIQCVQLLNKREKADCEKFLEVYYNKIIEDEDFSCDCGQSKSCHTVLIYVVQFLQGQTGVPLFSSFFKKSILLARDLNSSHISVTALFNQNMLSLLQFIPFLSVLDPLNSSIDTDIYKAILRSIRLLGDKTPYPFSQFYPVVEPTVVNTVLENCICYPDRFSWPLFYSRDWNNREILTVQEVNHLQSRIARSLQNAIYCRDLEIERDTLMLIVLAHSLYYDGHRAFIDLFHQYLRLRKSDLLLSWYLIVMTNISGFGLTKQYLENLYSIIKNKCLYIKEYDLEFWSVF